MSDAKTKHPFSSASSGGRLNPSIRLVLTNAIAPLYNSDNFSSETFSRK